MGKSTLLNTMCAKAPQHAQLTGSIDVAQAEALTQLVTDLHATDTWKATLEENNWADAFLAGEEFETFLDEHRRALDACLDGLTEQQARRSLVPS